MATQITDPKIITDDGAVVLVPNSVSFTFGDGMQNVMIQSAGGGAFETVIADDISTHVAELKFQMNNTLPNINLSRKWKKKPGAMSFTLIGSTPEGALKVTFSQATVTNDPSRALSPDGKSEVEIKAVKVSA